MKKILVTGGAGFIGSNLIDKLLEDGQYEVTCLDNFDDFYPREIKMGNLSNANDHPKFKLIEGDIRNPRLDSLLGTGYDCVVHLAARAGVRSSIDNPRDYIDINISGTVNVLEYAKNAKINNIIFGSSSSVYGINPDTPWSEESKLMPISPYAVSKIGAEEMGRVYAELYNINFTALRFFTVYGPRQRPDLAINKFFKALVNDEEIEVYGDGKSIRDYTHVDDVVSGIVLAIESSLSGHNILNIASSNPVDLMTLIKTQADIASKEAKIRFLDPKQGDVPSTYGDIKKAFKLIKYVPKTNLKTGLDNYYQAIISGVK